jgi:hypothetical protein
VIRFHNLPANEKAADQMVEHAGLCGIPEDEARKFADAACSLVLATFRSFDEKIEAITSDPQDQAVIQQMVLMQVIGISENAMRMNALRGLMHILGGKL